jgi:hypothetical protein
MMLMVDPSDSWVHEPSMTCSISVHDARQRVRESRPTGVERAPHGAPAWSYFARRGSAIRPRDSFDDGLVLASPLDSPAVVGLNRYPSALRPQPCLGRVALSGRTSKGTRMEEAGPTPSSRQRRGRPVRIGAKRAIIDRN